MKIRIAISPCPNDTFIFEAIYKKEIVLDGIDFEFYFEDVQTLNEMAQKGEADLIKISYAHYFSVMDKYLMLRSGGALGKGVGPLLVSLPGIDLNSLPGKDIAIPGKFTTANFLLTYALPELQNKEAYTFDKVERAVIDGEVAAGVIIHENRFTYMDHGLSCLMDLGAYWEKETGLPIPLGGIAIKRQLPASLQISLDHLIAQSISLARTREDTPSEFVKQHAAEMQEEVIKKHIALYVNDFSRDIGDEGISAVMKMKEILGNDSPEVIFVSSQ